MIAARDFACVFLILLGFAGPAAARAPIAACKPEQVLRPPRVPATDARPLGGLRPVPKNPAQCTLGVPLTVEAGVTLWRCLIEAPDDDGRDDEERPTNAFLVERLGHPVQVFSDAVMAGRYDAWHVIKVDLDADRQTEWVVALWNAQGNGLGINTWTIRVFSSDWRPMAEFPDVLDWGPSSVVRRPGARGACDLALTSYVDDRSTGRPGTALEARFARLVDGRLAPAEGRPPLRRWLTQSLMRERTSHYRRDDDAMEGDVARWLSRSTVRPAR